MSGTECTHKNQNSQSYLSLGKVQTKIQERPAKKISCRMVVRKKRKHMHQWDLLHCYGYWRRKHFGKHSDVFDVRVREKRSTPSFSFQIFQRFYEHKETGVLDLDTLGLVKEKRCGMPDFPENFTTDKIKLSSNEAFHTELHILRRWVNKTHLTWNLVKPTNQISEEDQRDTIRKAFNLWASVIPLNFVEGADDSAVDIEIIFTNGSHGDRFPFDGKNGILAHTFQPGSPLQLSGDVHIDDDENWSTEEKNDSRSGLFLVVVHELGHSLGLYHSNNHNSVMFANFHHRESVTLSAEDVRSIQYLYGTGTGHQVTRPPKTFVRPTAVTSQTPDNPSQTTIPSTSCNCNIQFDFVLQDGAVYQGIKDDQVFLFSQKGFLLQETCLHDMYPGAPVKADIVFNNPGTRSTYFLKGDQVWKFSDFVLQRHFPKRFNASLFPETVEFIYTHLDSWNIWRTLVFGKTSWFDYDFAEPSRPVLYFQSIADHWWGTVPSDVKYAVMGEDHYVYFVSNDSYFLLNYTTRYFSDVRHPGQPHWIRSVCHQTPLGLNGSVQQRYTSKLIYTGLFLATAALIRR